MEDFHCQLCHFSRTFFVRFVTKRVTFVKSVQSFVLEKLPEIGQGEGDDGSCPKLLCFVAFEPMVIPKVFEYKD